MHLTRASSRKRTFVQVDSGKKRGGALQLKRKNVRRIRTEHLLKVINVHERVLSAPAAAVGDLLDSLSSAEDALWPHDKWPAMRLDAPLGLGASGGHGPIRYSVCEYEPGRRVCFSFTAPRGFEGTHCFEVEPVEEGSARLRHVVEMDARWPAFVSWPLVFGPLHDSLLEDCLDAAARSLGDVPQDARWSLRTKLLRRVLSRRGDRRGTA